MTGYTQGNEILIIEWSLQLTRRQLLEVPKPMWAHSLLSKIATFIMELRLGDSKEKIYGWDWKAVKLPIQNWADYFLWQLMFCQASYWVWGANAKWVKNTYYLHIYGHFLLSDGCYFLSYRYNLVCVAHYFWQYMYDSLKEGVSFTNKFNYYKLCAWQTFEFSLQNTVAISNIIAFNWGIITFVSHGLICYKRHWSVNNEVDIYQYNSAKDKTTKFCDSITPISVIWFSNLSVK